MNKNDYRKYFDRIKCSAEFREKMEKRLASEPDDEYEDSVSDVEHAPRINYHRWTALVASAFIVIGIGGFAFLSHNDINSDSVGSEISSEVVPLPAPSSRYSIEISVSGAFSKTDKMTSIGTVPPEFVDRYLNEMKSWSEFELDNTPSLLNESTGAVTLSFTGEENFTWQIYSNGYTVTNHNGEETSAYYSDVCYHSLLSWIARDIPYFDWTYMFEGSNGIELETVFRNHIDEIEVTDSHDGINGMRFFECGSFSGTIDKNGNFRIYYDNEQDFISFKSSPEFYEEISKVVSNEITDAITDTSYFVYISRAGQTANTMVFDMSSDYMIKRRNELYRAIESLEWSRAKMDYQAGEVFQFGNIIVRRNGIIYNTETGIMYTAQNQDTSGIIDAIEEMTKINDMQYIMYLIASSDNRFDTMSAKAKYMIVDCMSGTGEFFYDNKNHSEYVNIKDENGNSLEFTMNSSQWTEKIIRDGITETSEGGLITKSRVDYEHIRSTLLDYMKNAFQEDAVTNVLDITSIEEGFYLYIDYTLYDVQNNISVNIDSKGNIVSLSMFRNTADTYELIESIDFTIGDGNGGGITYDNAEINSEAYGLDD